VQTSGASDGTGAGYVLAVILPALLFGGIAALCRVRRAESLGCFVGGFCLSMWFLCLKQGGLIQNKIGRSIFIVIMTVSIGSLGVFKVTRRPALIACMPFAGATVLVLGIDCFTRAGLKEFWIYNWGKTNNSTFGKISLLTRHIGPNTALYPLNTTTYPFTKGIQAEVGVIILIWLTGVVACWQWWKILRKLEAEKEAERRRQIDDLDRMEREAGMRATLMVDHEKKIWEKKYDKGKQSTTTMTEKNMGRMSTISIAPEGRDTLELIETDAGLVEIGRQQSPSQGASRTSRIEQRPSSRVSRPPTASRASSGIFTSLQPQQRPPPPPQITQTPIMRAASTTMQARQSNPPPASPPPPIISRRNSKRTSTQSISQHAESDSRLISNNSDLVLEDDATSTSTFQSARSSLVVARDELDAVSVPELDDATSAASKLDARPGAEPVYAQGDQASNHESPSDFQTLKHTTIKTEETPLEDNVNEDIPPPLPVKSSLRVASMTAVVRKRLSDISMASTHGKQSETATLNEGQINTTSPSSHKGGAVNEDADKESSPIVPTASPQLSGPNLKTLKANSSGSRALKAIKQHKIFEWAKHSTLAEQPPQEELPPPRPESPGVHYEINQVDQPRSTQGSDESREEAQDLLQPLIPLTSSNRGSLNKNAGRNTRDLASSPTGGSNRSSLNHTTGTSTSESFVPHNQPDGSNGSSINQYTGKGAALSASSMSTPSLVIPSSDFSIPLRSPSRPNSRNTSQPILGQLCESPVEDESHRATEFVSSLPTKSGTLLSQREHKLKTRVSTTAFNNFSRSSTNVSAGAGQREVSSGPSSSLVDISTIDLDNIPLSQRKNLLRGQTQPDLIHPRSQSRNSLNHRSSSQLGLPQYPSKAQRRVSDSASTHLNISQRLSQQNLVSKFDSHQPLRPENRPTTEHQAARLASWRVSLQSDPKYVAKGSSSIESARQQMLHEKRVKDQYNQQQEMAKQHFGVMVDQTMRNADGMWLHQKRLSKLQAQVKLE